eukprot:3654820-Prymnesium_polylepis.1
MAFWNASYCTRIVARNGLTTAAAPSWIEMALATIARSTTAPRSRRDRADCSASAPWRATATPAAAA